MAFPNELCVFSQWRSRHRESPAVFVGNWRIPHFWGEKRVGKTTLDGFISRCTLITVREGRGGSIKGPSTEIWGNAYLQGTWGEEREQVSEENKEGLPGEPWEEGQWGRLSQGSPGYTLLACKLAIGLNKGILIRTYFSTQKMGTFYNASYYREDWVFSDGRTMQINVFKEWTVFICLFF